MAEPTQAPDGLDHGSQRASDAESPNPESPGHPGLLSSHGAARLIESQARLGPQASAASLISTSAPAFTFSHLQRTFGNSDGDDGEDDADGAPGALPTDAVRRMPPRRLSNFETETGPSDARGSGASRDGDDARVDSGGAAVESGAPRSFQAWTSSVYRVEIDKNNKIRVLRTPNNVQLDFSPHVEPLSTRGVPFASFLDQVQAPGRSGGATEAEGDAARAAPEAKPTVAPLQLTAQDLVLPHRRDRRSVPNINLAPKLGPPPGSDGRVRRSHSRSSSVSSIASMASIARPQTFLNRLLHLGGLLRFADDDDSDAGVAGDDGFHRVPLAGPESGSKPLSRTPSLLSKFLRSGRSASTNGPSGTSSVGRGSGATPEAGSSPRLDPSAPPRTLVLGDPQDGRSPAVKIDAKVLERLSKLSEQRAGLAASGSSANSFGKPPEPALGDESAASSSQNSSAASLLGDSAVADADNAKSKLAPPPAENSRPRHQPTPSNATLNERYGALLEMLGKGAFGEVNLANLEERGADGVTVVRRAVAVKSFRRRRDESEREYSKKAIAEFCIASSLVHANVVRTFELIKDASDDWSVVMELMRGGDLFSRVRALGALPTDEANCYFKQLLAGVAYLHSMGVAHRDIKPENLLLDRSCRLLKLADFGTSEVFRTAWQKEPRKLKGVVGSGPYIAPEEFEKDCEYDAPKVDIWACAMIYHTMVFHAIPWRAAKASDPLYAVFVKQRQAPQFSMSRLSPPVRALIYRMFEPDSSLRASAADLLDDAWMRSVQCCGSDPAVVSAAESDALPPVAVAPAPNDVYSVGHQHQVVRS